MRSAEVETVAPVFEKSATEKLPRCKNIINIARFNVRTLNTVNHLLALTASAAERNIDIICIQERRYFHSEQEIKYHETSNG